MNSKITRVDRNSGRLIMVQVVCKREILNIVSAYAPPVGRKQEDELMEKFEGAIERVPGGEKIIIGGYFNTHTMRAYMGNVGMASPTEEEIDYWKLCKLLICGQSAPACIKETNT